MSEPVVKSRQPVDLEEFERRLRGPDREKAQHEDPLAELARLVEGGHDPFDGVFAKPVAARAPQPTMAPPSVQLHHDDMPHTAPHIDQSDYDREVAAWSAEDAANRGMQNNRAAAANTELHHAAHDDRVPPQHGAADVQAGAYNSWNDDDQILPPPPPAVAPRSRTGLYAMSGALAVVVLGIGGTFALKSGPSGAKDAPMIKAAIGPAKVQPDSATAAAPTQTVGILDKANEKLTTSKIVSSVEQPVDVNSQARPPRSTGPTPQIGNSIFPEPKRVKTVSVRPDGSIIGADIPVASTSSTGNIPTPASRPTAVAPQRQVAMATPVAATPKPVATAKTTTRVAARTDLDDDDAPAAKTATPKPAAAKPVQKAAVDPQPAAGDGFAVQLGSAGSDAEAREKASRMQQQYGASFGGRRATVTKGEVNGKTVYRVRLVGLTQENATAVCGKVKGGGGDCFVAR